MGMEQIELTLGLSCCSFLSCKDIRILREKLDNLEDLTVLSIEEICRLVGRRIQTGLWNPSTLRSRVDFCRTLMERYRISMTTIDESDYPPLVREIFDPPFAIFWRGLLPDPEQAIVAMVGTRSPTGVGIRLAERIGRDLGERGIPVVSGLARGIDAFSHKGNCDGGGKSIAVLACGLERIYPKGNSLLAGRLLDKGGCLIGEYPPGDPPLTFHFPQRNRLISALARSVVVIEAPKRSGALITADFALEQGRDLFVARDALHSARAEGLRMLREQGAPAISSAGDIIESWDSNYAACVTKQLALDF